MSSQSDYEGRQDERPTLPPIRDLFREELSGGLRAPQDSPALTLARLHVSDESDESPPSHGRRHPSHGGCTGSSLQPGRRPSSDSRSLPDSSASAFHLPQRFEPARVSRARLSPDFSRGRSEHPRSISFDYSSRPSHQTSPAEYHPHRHSISTADSPYHSRGPRHPTDDRTPVARYPPSESVPYLGFDGTQSPGYLRQPWPISTSVPNQRNRPEDEQQTPIARYRDSGPSNPLPSGATHHMAQVDPAEATGSTPAASKYECSYCGKGFNRPSSLKIHLNSHTGEKPFVCPVESCGRSFSVLSNMRRHARVHTQTPHKPREPSSDDGSERSPLGAPSHSSQGFSQGHAPQGPTTASHRWQRRDSSVSASSASSRRSRSVSSNDDDEDENIGNDRPEKRTRRYPMS